MIVTITGYIFLGALGAFIILPWFAWMLSAQAHRGEAARNEVLKCEIGALNGLLSEYEQKGRIDDVISRRLIMLRSGAYDAGRGREN